MQKSISPLRTNGRLPWTYVDIPLYIARRLETRPFFYFVLDIPSTRSVGLAGVGVAICVRSGVVRPSSIPQTAIQPALGSGRKYGLLLTIIPGQGPVCHIPDSGPRSCCALLKVRDIVLLNRYYCVE
jgi:hypothetical protein